MKGLINYILDGFGFTDWIDFKISTFGFIGVKSLAISSIIGAIASCVNSMFGVSLTFLTAYFVLILFEWSTGIMASFKRGEKHRSRKLGRMLFKVSVYAIPLYIFNMFQKEVDFPVIMGFEIDPFTWLYWTVIVVIIWQLFVSLLENMEQLNVKYAKVMLKIINKKFYKNLGITEKELKS